MAGMDAAHDVIYIKYNILKVVCEKYKYELHM